VKPYYILFRDRIIESPRPFDDASFHDVTGRLLRDGQGDPLVLPVIEIRRGIAVDAHMGDISTFASGLVLPKPIVGSVLTWNSAAMGVDRNAVVVEPKFAGVKT
jgi:hypothetical protein